MTIRPEGLYAVRSRNVIILGTHKASNPACCAEESWFDSFDSGAESDDIIPSSQTYPQREVAWGYVFAHFLRWGYFARQ
jgi:hypothetical protein